MATLSNKINLLRGLINGETAQSGPLYATVDITMRCNLKCLWCRYHSPLLNRSLPGKDLPFEIFEKLCADLKALDTEVVVIEGEGEPFLHPRVLDMVAVAKGHGFRAMLFTNGTFLNEKNMHLMVESYLDTLKVSLLAASPEEYGRLHVGTSPDFFTKIVNRLEQLAAFKEKRNAGVHPAVELCFPIDRYNYQHIDSMVELARNTGCNGIYFSRMNPYRGAFDKYATSAEEEKLVFQSLKQAKKRLNSLSLYHNIDPLLQFYAVNKTEWLQLPCYVAWYHTRIKADGDIRACNLTELPLGNLYEQSFLETWNSRAFRAFRKKCMAGDNHKFKELHCEFECCFHTIDNKRVDRFFKWLSPFLDR